MKKCSPMGLFLWLGLAACKIVSAILLPHTLFPNVAVLTVSSTLYYAVLFLLCLYAGRHLLCRRILLLYLGTEVLLIVAGTLWPSVLSAVAGPCLASHYLYLAFVNLFEPIGETLAEWIFLVGFVLLEAMFATVPLLFRERK